MNVPAKSVSEALLSDRWIKDWSRAATLQKAIVYAQSIGKPFEDFFGLGLHHALYFSSNDQLDCYYLESERLRFNEYARQKLCTDEAFLSSVRERYFVLYAPHLELLKTILNRSLTDLSDEQLGRLFADYKRSVVTYTVPLWLCYIIEKQLEESVQWVFESAGVKEVDKAAMAVFSLSEPNYLIREEFELLDISRLSADQQHQALDRHAHKYAYISMYDYGHVPQNRAFFAARMEELKRNDGDKILEKRRQFEENKRQFEELVNSDIFSPHQRIVLGAMHFLFNQKDQRSHYRSYDAFVGHKLFEELANRIGVSLETILFMRDVEIENALLHRKQPTDLEKRMQTYALLITPSNELLWTGQDAKAVLDKISPEKQLALVKGRGVSGGKTRGVVRIVNKTSDLVKVRESDILVASMTRPDYVSAMKKCAAIVTDEGGVLCHAAIVSRELGIPCVVGTKNATAVFQDGDTVEVDAQTGIVRKR